MSKKLIKDEIFEALLSRRTYSTESKSLRLDATLNGKCIGSILNHDKSLKFDIKAFDDKIKIDKIQIVTNGGKVVKEKEFSNANEINWNFSLRYDGKNNWYLVKLIQNGDRVTITSPFFMGE
ncbi:hypothetical protein ACER0A_009605 [Haloimpatiens sp. FM7315]|uniref:hypothetical protein n=1 Tax=Haloimpatiens sp. FM7315 TaxID=3298609 RepID=UPI0035A36B69